MEKDFQTLPEDLPVPEDDGAADHLTGMNVPRAALKDSSGNEVDLGEACAGLAVVFIYPRTGTPGLPLIDGWDQIPGARGCTPQSCAYRDRIAEFEERGAAVHGLSSQDIAQQAEFKEREGIPYPILNDSPMLLAYLMKLPTFEAGGMSLYRRLTFIAVDGVIEKVFYPVFPPNENAAGALDWLSSHN